MVPLSKRSKRAYAGGQELGNRTLGILGFGRIGQETAKIGLAMGMIIKPVDPYVKSAKISMNLQDKAVSVSIDTVSMDEMLADSDVITVHVPFSGDKPLIGSAEMAKMKDGVILVNTARGGIIGEEEPFARARCWQNQRCRSGCFHERAQLPIPDYLAIQTFLSLPTLELLRTRHRLT